MGMMCEIWSQPELWEFYNKQAYFIGIVNSIEILIVGLAPVLLPTGPVMIQGTGDGVLLHIWY